jgi:hypothetical protein
MIEEEMIIGLRRLAHWGSDIWGVVKSPPSIAALVYSAIAFGGSQIVDHYHHIHERQERQIEVLVTSFIDTTREFDALVASLANGVIDKNGPDIDDRTKLIANLNRQYSEISQLEPLTKDHPELLDAYRSSISKLNDQLPKVNSVMEMKGFWEAVGDVLSTRRKLDQQILRSSHLALE